MALQQQSNNKSNKTSSDTKAKYQHGKDASEKEIKVTLKAYNKEYNTKG